MGVVYSTSIAWGLAVPHTEELDGIDFHDAYKMPEGFTYEIGGDMMNGKDMFYVVHPEGACVEVMTTLKEGSFGAHAIGDIYTPTKADYLKITGFAQANGFAARFGWYAITSVG